MVAREQPLRLKRASAAVVKSDLYWPVLRLRLLLFWFFATLQPVAFAVHLHDVNVMCEAVEQCAGYESDLAPHQRLLKPKTSTVKNILNGFYPKDMAHTLSDIQSKVNKLWEASLCDESCVLSFEVHTQKIAEQDLKQNTG